MCKGKAYSCQFSLYRNFTLSDMRLILFIVCFFFLKIGFAQEKRFIEINGVVMTADSLRYLPFLSIERIGKADGTYTSNKGVFSLMVEPGDTLEFTYVGYKTKRIQIGQSYSEERYSLVQLMVQDTFYLPETYVRPGPKKEEFDFAFKNWPVPDDKIELARKNTEVNTLRVLAYMLPKDGREQANAILKEKYYNFGWEGLAVPNQKIFSPWAWQDFIQAWKRGDFKRKK
jgi:hypothetical protein